jgi:hypothetical protein
MAKKVQCFLDDGKLKRLQLSLIFTKLYILPTYQKVLQHFCKINCY